MVAQATSANQAGATSALEATNVASGRQGTGRRGLAMYEPPRPRSPPRRHRLSPQYTLDHNVQGIRRIDVRNRTRANHDTGGRTRPCPRPRERDVGDGRVPSEGD